ncbi:MAG: T9SS type A sorting domain-containing protein [Candidatus Cloacimonetes bacterium]|nr:T9SS type A sorting domain-containing protein [Candidatus Cloacimonadota bacterium]
MKKVTWLLVAILFSSLSLHSVWTDIRNSSFTAEEEIFIQYESSLTGNSEHRIFYYLDDEWHFNSANNLNNNTYQGTIPFNNNASLPLSFRIDIEEETYLIPGFSSQQPLTLQEMTTLSEYPRNNDIPDHLNIAGEKMLFSDDQLFFAFTNFGGGFPVSGGTYGPFYTYAITIWPQVTGAPDYVYILLYTINLAPYINSGLYKIDVATEDMTQIGSVSTQTVPDINTLFISCLIDDLINDPDFAAAFAINEVLIIGSLTQQIEDFGATITIMDEGKDHHVYLQKLVLEPFVNNLPQINNVLIEEDQGSFLITLDYYDPDRHFPLISEVQLDSGNTFYFIPHSFDYTDTVIFSSLFTDFWSTGTIIFSDNGFDLVEVPISNVSSVDAELPLPHAMKIYPNPFAPSVHQEKNLFLQVGDSKSADIKIYNLKGQQLFSQRDCPVIDGSIILPYHVFENSLTSSGIYFIKLDVKNEQLESKEIIIDKFLYLR